MNVENWKSKSFLAKALALLLVGFGLGAYSPLAPMVADVGCAMAAAAGGGCTE